VAVWNLADAAADIPWAALRPPAGLVGQPSVLLGPPPVGGRVRLPGYGVAAYAWPAR
jgi:hypothetical protein